MRRMAAVLLGAMLTLARSGGAQVATTGTIQGRVIGRDSAGVPSATIRATRAGLAVGRDATSDQSGSFRLGFLPPGDYRLSVRRIGFRPAIVERVTVVTGSVTRLTIVLEAAALALDSIVVSAPPVTIDAERTEFGTAIGAAQLRLLPVPNEARNLVAFANGARPDQVWGGATAQANNYQLDGVAVNHPGVGGDLVQPSVSWIEEIQVRGLGAGAEHGNFQGGIVNIVTKSGSNRQEGAVRLTAENRRLNGSNLRINEAGTEVSDRLEFDGQIRGPIKRDRLFYAAFGQVVSRDLRVLNQVPLIDQAFVPQPPHETEGRFLGKLNWQPTDRDAVTASLARFHTNVDRFGQRGFFTPGATQRFRQHSWLGSLAWQRTWSSRSFLEVKLSAYDGTERRDPYGAPTVPGLQIVNQVDPNGYQNAAFSERRDPASLSATAVWDIFQKLGGTEHHLKIGGEYGAGKWSYFRERNGGLTWRPGDVLDRTPAFDPALPATWRFNNAISSTWGGEVAIDSRVQNNAIFIQDYIRLSQRLTVNPGVRYGRWLGQLSTPTGYNTIVEDGALEGRIGLNWAVARDGSLAFKAHWGRYHQSMFAGFFDRSANSGVYTDEERWEYTGPLFSDPTTTFSQADRDRLAGLGQFRRAELIRLSETGVVKDYRQPYVDQAVIGLEKSFGSRWRAEALYVNRRNRNMVGLIDRNADKNNTTYYNLLVLDRFFRTLRLDGEPLRIKRLAISHEDIIYWYNQLLANGNVGFPGQLPPLFDPTTMLFYEPDYVLTNLPEAKREMDQVQFRVEARYPSWWFDLGATVTRLEGNLNTIVGADDYSGSSAGPYVRVNEGFESFGRLNNQSRVEAKLRVGGNLPFGVRGGAFASFLSGDYFTWTLDLSNLLWQFRGEALPEINSSTDPVGKGQLLRSHLFGFTTGHRIFIEPRGSRRYPSRFTLDLHLERGFQLGKTSLLATLDGFNVLGGSSVVEVQTSYNGDVDPRANRQLAAVRNRMAPRTIRVGTGITF